MPGATPRPRRLLVPLALGSLLMIMACQIGSPTAPAPTAPPPTVPANPTSRAAATRGAAPHSAPAATSAASSVIAKNPSYSSAIAISDDDSTLVVANPLDGSVSIFNVAGDANTKLGEVKTGNQPRTVAISPDK